MIKGVLFDMDGVLLDTERIYQRLEAQAARQMGYSFSEEYLRGFCGMVAKSMNEKLARDYPGLDTQAYHALTSRLIDTHLKEQGVPPKPHAEETLKALRVRGIKMAVASSTNTANVREYLQLAGLAPYFDKLVGGDRVQNGKPAPDIFLFAARQLGLAPAQCAVVEDSYNGIRAAAAAGCLPVMIPDVLPPTEEMRGLATAILGDLSYLPGFIGELNG